MKQCLSIMLTIVITLNLFPLIAFAEDTNKTYIYDNYTIKYNIVNSWENNQNIEITITNTSAEPIESWMLSYDFCGEIQGIWNAEMKTTENDDVYIKNAGYNCVIEPGCSVNFGYTLTKAKGFPSKFSMCQERVSKAEGYEVTLNVIDSWEDNSFQGEIVITNNTDTTIECWELDIDSNFTIAEITNSWAATVSAYEEEKYTLKGTYTNIIYPNSSSTLGFLGVKNGEPEIYDYSLTEIVVGEVSKSEDNNDDTIVSVEGMYYKDIQSDDEVNYDGNGIYFVRNQLLITAYQDVSFEEIEALVEEMDAKIVGYIGVTNDYQIEFNSDVSTEYLCQQIDHLVNYPFIEYVSLNTAFKLCEKSLPLEYNFDWENGDDDLWYIDEINAHLVWEKYNEKTSLTKIGLIDTAFDYLHNDLLFKQIWENPEYNTYNKDTFEHGTHVAGIMGAMYDNGIGIAGICSNNELYGYAMATAQTEFQMIMKYKIAIATQITTGVKVINISLGVPSRICIGASLYNNDNAKRYIEDNSIIIEKFVEKLINLNYDFLIVTTAGNENDNRHIEDNTEYGCTILSEVGEECLNCAKAEYGNFWNYIGYEQEYNSVKERIIVVGSIGHYEDINFYSHFSNFGERIDVVAPGEKILSTLSNYVYDNNCLYTYDNYPIFIDKNDPSNNNNTYTYMDGTSMAAPQVAGVAGMMYSVNPSLTAEQIKEIIVETATEEVSGYGLLNAYAAVNRAYFTPSVGSEEIYDGLLMGKTLKSNGDEFENVTINVYKYNQTNPNIPPTSEVVTATKGDEILYTTTSNEFGDYVLRLGNNDMYWIEYVYDGYKTEKFITYINSRQLIVQDVTMERVNTLATVISNAKEESQMGAYVEVVSILKNDSFDGEYATKYDDGSYTFMVYSNDTGSVTGSSDENGVFTAMLDDGTYDISVNKEGYIPTTIQVEAKDEKVYDENGEILEKITLTPIEASIYGTVTRKNLTTGEEKPQANYTLRILKDGEEYMTATTQADGTYKAQITEYGTYTIVCNPDNQSEHYIGMNGDFLANFTIEYEEEEDEEGNDDEESDDSIDVGEDDITINLNNDENPSFSLGNEIQSLAEGIWFKIFVGAEERYIKLYTLSDSGEYTTKFGSPGFGLYTTQYHYWNNGLMMDTYNKNGALLSSRKVENIYEEIYISLSNIPARPLMRIESITSLAVNANGISYNLFTDGYYKAKNNSVGSTYVEEEKWEDNKTYTITSNEIVGVSTKSPF